MHFFEYRDGIMHAEDVDLRTIAAEVGTPFYCYSRATLERHYRVFDEAFAGVEHMICYSPKANSNLAVMRTLAELGAGMDVVSEGELRRARRAGVPASRIVFSGVGKTDREISYALDEDIHCFNVESVPELEVLSQIAASKGKTARISLRINPDVDAQTHQKISTGKAENKFGISWADAESIYDRARNMPGLRIIGVDMHIGSQITSLEPFEKACILIGSLVERLRAAGHDLHHIDLGGGLGIPYRDSDPVPPLPAAYAEMAKRTLGHLGCKFILEPGRLIAGNAGIMVTRVIYVKRGDAKTFVIADGAMNDLIRPTLYEAFHEIRPVVAEDRGEGMLADLVGPICESGDFLAQDRILPQVERGDLLAVMTAGAYGAVQSGTYNTRPLVPEVLVSGDRFALVRRRPTYDEMIDLDSFADWQRLSD
ncbi:diaminopimelate decarboxylase [Rhodoligotrophos appendicifer]|uniref:diaminopimelate decarboxylase n=1 Tax=Rhodoligotrophos appendicifer TaxID=987056 RepID=UPI001184B48A|nr:diaminopimelate decarboxylase [Rhodoligotrophos appendicifer]